MPRVGEYSHHARVRMQQRGISEQALNLLLRYGRSAHHQPVARWSTWTTPPGAPRCATAAALRGR
jgi:Domain of unknown function (DUF4258)